MNDLLPSRPSSPASMLYVHVFRSEREPVVDESTAITRVLRSTSVAPYSWELPHDAPPANSATLCDQCLLTPYSPKDFTLLCSTDDPF